MVKKAYLISNIEDYGKFISWCIDKDISVFRTYWDEREKGDRCFVIDYKERRCYYSSRSYWEDKGFAIVIPKFIISCGSYVFG